MPLLESIKNMFKGSSCGCTKNKTFKRTRNKFRRNKRSRNNRGKLRGGYQHSDSIKKNRGPSKKYSKKSREPVIDEDQE